MIPLEAALERLDQLAAHALQKAHEAELQGQQDQYTYWRGCAFGLETAAVEIRALMGQGSNGKTWPLSHNAPKQSKFVSALLQVTP